MAMDRTGMVLLLERLVRALYGGSAVPALEGGRLFHAICDECRRRGDVTWTESRIQVLARELGYWPWSVNQIDAALRNARLESPASNADAVP